MRKYLLVVIFAAALFTIPSFATAMVGVSPASYNVHFVPGLKQTLSFEFFTDSDVPLQVYTSGDLANYTTLSTTSLSGGNGGVTVILQLPDKVPTPGTHTIIIGAKQAAGGTQGFGIVGNIQGLINVAIPYPGQYALLDFRTTNANAGEPVNLSGTITNLGNEAVSGNLWIDIYANETKLNTVNLGTFNLSSPDKQDFFTTLDTNGMKAGTYRAVANFLYGNNNLAQADGGFRLGELRIIITNYTNVFERDKINRMQIEVESLWNDQIPGVYANVSLIGYPMQFITPSVSVNGFDKGYLTGFFDTTGITNDSFNARIAIEYAGKEEVRTVPLSFRKQTNYLMIGLIAAVVIVLALIVIVTVLLRKKSKKRR